MRAVARRFCGCPAASLTRGPTEAARVRLTGPLRSLLSGAHCPPDADCWRPSPCPAARLPPGVRASSSVPPEREPRPKDGWDHSEHLGRKPSQATCSHLASCRDTGAALGCPQARLRLSASSPREVTLPAAGPGTSVLPRRPRVDSTAWPALPAGLTASRCAGCWRDRHARFPWMG